MARRLEQPRQRPHARAADADQMNLHRAHLPARHSLAWGGALRAPGGTVRTLHLHREVDGEVAEEAAARDRRSPPDVSQAGARSPIEPQGSMRPRLRLFASALHASAASRLQRPPGPVAAHPIIVVPPGPFGPYSAISSDGRDAASLGRLARREGEVRRRSGQHVDVEARLVGAGREVTQGRRIQRRAAADAREPDLEPFVLLVGRRRSRRRRSLAARRCRVHRPCSARRPGSRRARPACRSRRRRTAPAIPAPAGPDATDPEHASARVAPASNAGAATRVKSGEASQAMSVHATRCGSGGRRRSRLRTIYSSCHAPFRRFHLVSGATSAPLLATSPRARSIGCATSDEEAKPVTYSLTAKQNYEKGTGGAEGRELPGGTEVLPVRQAEVPVLEVRGAGRARPSRTPSSRAATTRRRSTPTRASPACTRPTRRSRTATSRSGSARATSRTCPRTSGCMPAVVREGPVGGDRRAARARRLPQEVPRLAVHARRPTRCARRC